MDQFTFFFFSSSWGSSPCVFFFFLSVSKFNLKYKTKLQSNYDVEAFSLAEIQYKNLQCWIYELLPTVYHGYIFTVLNICVDPSRRPTHYVKTCFIKLFIVGLCERRTSYSTFRHNLLQHLGEHSISTELLQAAWLLPSTKSAWNKGSWESSWSFLSFLPPSFFFFLFSFFFWKFSFPPAPRGLISTSR